MKKLLLLMLVVMVVSPNLAQVIAPTSKFILNVDYSRFKNNDTTGYVELYYLFYPGLVSVAHMSDGSYAGKISLQILGRQTATGDVYVNEMRMLPVTVQDSSQLSTGNTVVSLSGYVLPVGLYEFMVVAVDSIDESRADSLSFAVTIPSLPSETSTSDLELCSRIQQANSGGPFVKNTLEVVPNATLVFGVSSHPVVFHYLELYNLRSDVEYVLNTSVLDAAGSEIKKTSRKRAFTVGDAVDVGTMNVSSIPSGRYIYQMSVNEEGGKEVSRTRKVFYIYNPHIKTAEMSKTSLKASELAGLDFDELGTEFESAKYLANGDEIDAFGKLTTADARREYLARFWTRVESGRNGRPPISRAEYLRRVQVAMQKYHLHGRPGWKTDRGRVYLLYGEPDEIERVPSSGLAKPYEMWLYYQIENGVQFVFIDRTGFGDYILVHSTKRNEIQDPAWQELLR